MSTEHSDFGDQVDLAERLLAALGPSGNDGSHDRSHLLRVWRNAMAIADQEAGCQPGDNLAFDRDILAAAVILHDCVAVEKNAPERSRASRLAAARARTIVAELGWDAARTDRLAHAIEAHSYSAGIAPRSLEARILQDADRLDAIGMVGAARCFYIAGRMGSALYDPADPLAEHRPLDDKAFAIDHFAAKLFKLADGFQTETGKALARDRHARLADILAMFTDEI